MNWANSKMKELQEKGFEIDVSDLKLPDGAGGYLEKLQFGTLTEKEMYAISKHPEVVARKDEMQRQIIYGLRVAYERFAKKDKDLTWDDFNSLDSALLTEIVNRMNVAAQEGLKN